MNKIIEIKNLFKNYNEINAIRGINLDVYKGEMFGLVGPDGAGKTTTIRILCGLLLPTIIPNHDSKIFLFEKNILTQRKNVQENIGYLSQKFSLYGDLTIDENIQFFAEIHGVKNYKARQDELLDFTRLKPFRKRLAEKLSGGMKQKLALACSLIHKPKILFLDEPTTGVDPISRRDFWKILSGLLSEGITIFMTTPYLDEAERCNRVAMMNDGNIITIGTPAEIKEQMKEQVIEIVCSPIKTAYQILKEKTDYEIQLFGDRINIVLDNSENELQKVVKFLSEKNINIESNRIVTPSLENIFIHLINNAELEKQL